MTTALVGTFVVPGVAQRERAPDLAVSAAAEPPDFEVAGGTWRLTLTVSNEGGRRASRSSVTRSFLSSGRRLDRNDVRLGGSATIAPLAAGAQTTRRVTVTIPRTVANGMYYLITCADATRRVAESTEGAANCNLSGQRIGIGVTAGERGPAGPAGPQGPQGAPGAKGERGEAGNGADFRFVDRVVLDPGTRTVDDPEEGQFEDEEDTETAPDEGSTSTRDLLKVGPLTFRALCADAETPAGGNVSFPNEAKILVYTDTGFMSFQGKNGPRGNVPAGNGIAGRDGADGGEGKHQLLGVAPFEGSGDDNDGVPFKAAEGFVTVTDGTAVAVSGLYAGIGVLGAGDEQCVFGGAIRVVNGG